MSSKCLVQYHPDHPHELRLEQEAQIRALYDAMQASGHELLLEVIPPKNGSAAVADDTVFRALKRLYNLGIYPEWWKLEPMSARNGSAIDALIAERDPLAAASCCWACRRRSSSLATASSAAAASSTCRGFTVGPHDLSRAEPCVARRRDRRRGTDRARAPHFETLIDAWRAARAEQAGACARTPGAGGMNQRVMHHDAASANDAIAPHRPARSV